MSTAFTAPQDFLDLAGALGVAFEGDELDRLGQFLEVMLETNRQFNLTSITEPADAWRRHIFDSLTLLPYLVQSGAKKVIDIGAGGGLPGIPLAILSPEVEFTLVEATGKKAAYLIGVRDVLMLDNVEIVNERAETLAQDHKSRREHYDLALARALGRLPVLLELTAAFVREGGLILAIKGEQAEAEAAEAKQAMHLLHLALVDCSRTPTGTVVVVEKLRKTPRIYPRRPGEPKRAPLGVGVDKAKKAAPPKRPGSPKPGRAEGADGG